jgi:cytochrome c-type biogenesis protein CcsB
MLMRWCLAAIVMVSAARVAVAQTAPAGNAHPETRMVESEASMRNPFGDPDPASRPTVEQKRAFASAVDLEPLRGVPVFHNGRVKVLDTLARETVSRLTGSKRYVEPVGLVSDAADAATRGEKIRFDPMFTLLDTLIDPAAYLDRPLIGVNYLPLRREMLELALPDDAAAQERWLRLGRVTPRMVNSFSGELFNRHSGEEPFRNAISRMEGARDLFLYGMGNIEVVAPAERAQKWAHLGTLPADHPAAQAALRLGTAWRAMDAAGVNAAAADLGSALAQIHPETQPTTRRSIELAYNRSNAFEFGFWFYLLSFVALVLAFGTGRRWLSFTGVGLFSVALAFHAFGFVTRCIVAERFAIQNQFESMTGLSLFATMVGLVLMVARRQWLFGAAAAMAGFLILVTATQTGIPGEHIEREAAILNTSVLLKYHVTTVLTSYGLITLGFVVSGFYLAVHYGGRLMGGRSEAEVVATTALGAEAAGQLPSSAEGGPSKRTLKDLDVAQMLVLQLAFWTLAVGILLGAWWADHSWGRWWAFDPKETWALLTWIVYLIVIHVRFTGLKDRGLTTAWLSVIGFVVMLWTYFGVNLLLPGLHAYA